MAQTWRTVRVFISSTFRDMHAERDHLVKVVFPELRERCAKRQLHLVDMDLRWGVTEDEAEQGKVLHIILDEIDRSRPFFVAILGERYGSVPDKVPEDTEFSHPWLRDYSDHSLTALEIIHGVLRDPDLAGRSFFYFRDPQFISQVPESKRADFTTENPKAVRKLATLKDKIRASGRPVMENYFCRWDEVEGRLVDLDDFGQQVLDNLWTAICKEYPKEAPEAEPLAIERQMHESFAEERSHLHVGRVEQAKQLTEYVQGTDRRPVVITGESGCGKSAFLASWYRRHSAENPDDFVLAYFVGASPDSTNHFRLLRTMCQELKHQFALEEEIPEDDKKLSETLAILLVAASWGRSRIILILDALDQLSTLKGAHGLGWLLDYMPEKARLVVSSLEGDCLDVLRRRQAKEITLLPLTEGEQKEIIQALLSEWRRKLNDQQMAALLAHPGVKNPLYLRVALEELRLFGRFEQLTARIEALGEDIPKLFDQMLVRLEKDHGHELVSEVFSLLGCSRHGLSEAELLDLLAREGEERFPHALWVRLARSATTYLVQRGELFGFFHRQLEDVVTARYPERESRHAKLAAYFAKAPLQRKLDEYPYQLTHAEQWSALGAALSELDFFDYAWEHDREYEWMGYWRSQKGRFEPGQCYRDALDAKEKLEGKSEDLGSLSHTIALFFYDAGSYDWALVLEERALETLIGVFGSHSPEVAESLNNLGRIHSEKGGLKNLRKALLIHQQALEIESNAIHYNDVRIANCLNNIAVIYAQCDLYKESLPIFNQALEILESKLGYDHLKVAMVLNNLGGLYHNKGAYAKAKSLYERVLDIEERWLDPHHPEVAATLNNLASINIEQGKYDEAHSLMDRAQTIWKRTIGLVHPRFAANLNNLATLYAEQQQYEKALPLFKHAVSIAEISLGRKHPDTKEFKDNLKKCAEYNQFSLTALVMRANRFFPGGAAIVAVALAAMLVFLPLKGGSLIVIGIVAPVAIGYASGRSRVRGAAAGLLLSVAVGTAWLIYHPILKGLPSINDSTFLGTMVYILFFVIWGALWGAGGTNLRKAFRSIFFVKMP